MLAVESIQHFDPLTGEVLDEIDHVAVWPATHYVTKDETIEGAVVEIKQELDGRAPDAGVSFTTVDVRDENAVAASDEAAIAAHGHLDAVVTAAGVAGGGPAHLVDRDEWQRVLDVNLTGTFLACKHAIARMLEQDPIDGERGSIVTIARALRITGTIPEGLIRGAR